MLLLALPVILSFPADPVIFSTPVIDEVFADAEYVTVASPITSRDSVTFCPAKFSNDKWSTPEPA